MSTEWYHTSAGEQLGPVTSADIRQLAADGALGPEDLVWNKSLTEWIPARRVKGLTFGGAENHVPVPHQAPTITAPSPPMDAQLQSAPTPSPMLGYESPGGEAVPVTSRAVELLQQTRPWVLTIAILMFIGAGFLALAAIGMVIFAMIGRGRTAATGLGLAFAYAVMAALAGGPPIFLAKFSSRISNLVRLRRAVDLESALEAQKSYWKFVTIATLILVVLYLAVIALLIIGRV